MNTINIIYFSPTKTTKRVLDYIAKGIELRNVTYTNITEYQNSYSFIESDITIIGFPVYGGRVPPIVLNRLSELRGNNSPVIIVALYGNRDFDDALIELYDFLEERGFKTISAASFIGEHSFSNKEYPIAVDRPDSSDLEKALDYGKEIQNRFVKNEQAIGKVSIPGNRPYKEHKPTSDFAPIVNRELCTSCGECVKLCPVGAISEKNPEKTDIEKCIKCAACVKMCPENARYFDNEYIETVQKKLYANFSKRKEPNLFF